MTVRRSTRFVTWVRSWRAGLVPYDEVAAEIAEDEEHLAADAPGTWTEVPLGEILSMFAKLHPDEVRVVLPVPGDPRGLPGPGAFSGAALVAEEAVVAGDFGLVPLVWSLFSVITTTCGISPLFSRSPNSRRNSSARI